jgi:hypothetical protein
MSKPHVCLVDGNIQVLRLTYYSDALGYRYVARGVRVHSFGFKLAKGMFFRNRNHMYEVMS